VVTESRLQAGFEPNPGDEMLLWIGISGYLIGMLGAAVMLGSQLRIASLEQEVEQWRRLYYRAVRSGIRRAANPAVFPRSEN
jgi:hypothetical protein